MARRNLCYKHNCEEFDKLPDILRPVAAEWHTVAKEKCELCQEKKIADLRAALEALEGEADKMRRLLIEITPTFYILTVQEYMPAGQMDKVQAWLQSTAPDKAIEQARAALAATGGKAEPRVG